MADDSAANAPSQGRKSASRDVKGGEKREKSWLVPLIAAIILASAFCLYYFVYVAAQRENLANRNFRSLAVLGAQIQETISIHSSILEYAADLAAPKKPNAQREKNDLSQFLVVREEDRLLPKEEREKETQKDYLKYLAPGLELTEIPIETTSGTPQQPKTRFETRRRNGRWELVLTAQRHQGAKNDHTGALDIEGMLQPLTSSLPFDDIMLASENGTIIYQHNGSGPRFTTLTGLLQAQANGPETATAGVAQNANHALLDKSKHLTDVDLAGTRYKLFLQPILVDVFSDEPTQTERAHEWVICGLQSAKGLEWEALSISSTVVIWFTGLFLAICLSGPILKMIFLNERERFRLRELGFLALFLILLTSVFTLAGIEAVIFPRSDNTEGQLNRIGDRLSGNIHWELRQMRDQLKAWCGDDLNHDLKLAEKHEVIRNTPDETAPNDTQPNKDTVTPAAHAYPYFTNAFWTDDDGNQIVKWSASAYSTPMIDVSKLGLFSHAKTTYLDGKGPPFYFDSARPPNKLEYLAGMSVSTTDCPARSLAGVREDIAGGSAFLTTHSLSLIDPILPFGYGFALLDERGSVLFHSDKTRNMHENFVEESAGSRQLYAAAFGHSTERFLSIKYLGKDYRARITPVPGISQAPWSLIVYRDLTPVRTLNLQAMTMTSSLFLMILAGPVIVIAIWCAIARPRFAPECLWPNQGRARTYLYQIFLYAALIVLFLIPGFTGSLEENVIACFLFTYAAVLLTLWCYRAFPPAPGKQPEERWGRLRSAGAMAVPTGVIVLILAIFLQLSSIHVLTYVLSFGLIVALPVIEQPRQYLATVWPHSFPPATAPAGRASNAWRSYYVLSVILLLLLVGVSIPMALYRVSMNVERRLGVKQAQLHLASALGQRLISIREQCDKGELGKAACDEFKDPRSDIWKRVVLDPLFPEDGKLPVEPHKPSPGGRELYRPWFRDLIYSLHHDYNQVAAEMLGVIPDRANAGAPNQFPDWAWENGQSPMTLRWHGIHLPAQPNNAAERPEDDLLIPAPAPVRSRVDGIAGAAVAAGAILAIGLLVWTLVPRIFLFHIAPVRMTAARRADEFLRAGGNAVILLAPGSEWSVEAKKWTLDLRAMATAPNWADAFDLDTLPLNTLIEIRHFEYNTHDAGIDNQKFTLIERLLKRESTQLAVILTVPASAEDYRRLFKAFEVIDLRDDSSYWLKQYEGPARDLIWKECGPLAALWPLGAQLAKDIKPGDAHSEETVAAEMLERADPYYRLVWKECSGDQKFALAQLAADGLVNPTTTNGRAVRQLASRGLITENPQFRIVNESLRRFLLSHTTADLKREWTRDSKRSGWGKIHGAFFTTMLILGAFLLTTQNELWQSSAAYVTTALGALGTLAKLFNTYRGGGAADKAS